MAQVSDTSGRPLLVAEETLVLFNPLTGTHHKVFAGGPVPTALQGAYLEAVGGEKKAKPKPKKQSKKD